MFRRSTNGRSLAAAAGLTIVSGVLSVLMWNWSMAIGDNDSFIMSEAVPTPTVGPVEAPRLDLLQGAPLCPSRQLFGSHDSNAVIRIRIAPVSRNANLVEQKLASKFAPPATLGTSCATGATLNCYEPSKHPSVLENWARWGPGDITPNTTVDKSKLSTLTAEHYFAQNSAGQQRLAAYFASLECMGLHYPAQELSRRELASTPKRSRHGFRYDDPAVWANRHRSEIHPIMNPLHAAVSPARLVKQARYLLKMSGRGYLLDRPRGANATMDPRRNQSHVIVEMGSGHGSLLAAMCPPLPNLHCHGYDFSAPLIDTAQSYFGYMTFAATTNSSHLPAEIADVVVSNGVTVALDSDAMCAHVGDGLRLLRPGGALLIWMLFYTPFRRSVRVHPSFFVRANWSNLTNRSPTELEAEARPEDVLPYCTGNLSQWGVSSVEVIWQDPAAAIYTPKGRVGGAYAIIIHKASLREASTNGAPSPAPVPDAMVGRSHPSRLSAEVAAKELAEWEQSMDHFAKLGRKKKGIDGTITWIR